MAFDIIITNAGRAALVNATATGTAPVTIAQIGITATAVTPVATATSLPGEIKRISAIGGVATGGDSIHVSMRDETTDAYTLRSFALYLADGTLFGIYGQSGAILSKTATVIALIGIDIVFADINSASLTFGATNFTDPDATTSKRGLVELATTAEATTGTDAARALTPAALAGALVPLLLARDGSGSGIDADLLDGQQGSYYADIAGRLGYIPANKAGDAFTGAITLPGDPTATGHATRKSYVDGLTTAAALLAKLITVDGAGSGLDADLLDGQQGAWYRDLANATGTLPAERLTGSYPNVESLTAAGSLKGILRHMSGYLEVLPFSATYDDGSRAYAYYDGNSRALRLNARDDTGAFTPLSIFLGGSPVWSGANDGAGSGLDADMLDGNHASAFVLSGTYTAVNVLAKLLTVDGSGSGIDADLLDGRHATDFALAADFEHGSNTRGQWEKRPNGVIEQWGRVQVTCHEGELTRTFPIPFTDPASVSFTVSAINADSGTNSANDIWAEFRSNTATDYTVGFQSTLAGTSCDGWIWRAIGV